MKHPSARAGGAAAAAPGRTLLVLLFACGILASCGPGEGQQGGAPLAQPAAAQSQDRAAAPTLVRVGAFARGEIKTFVDVSTDVEAEFVVEVFPKVGGAFIKEMNVQEGDAVAAGAPLLLLDDIDFRIEVRRRESQLLQAKQTEQQRKVQLSEAHARERAQQVVFERARADHERALNAMKGDIDVLSAKELNDAEATYQQAMAELEAAKLAAERGESEQELARLSCEAAAIELEAAQNDLDQTMVRSPISGVVQRRNVNAGLLVSPATHLFTVIDPTRLIASLRIPQEDLRVVSRTGLPVEFRCDALPGRVFTGVVEAINPAVDPTSGLVKVRVRLDAEAAGQVLPGMFSRARIIVESRDDAVLLNKRAVVYDEGNTYFFAVEGEAARRHAFQPGASTENEIEVLKVDGADAETPENLALRVIFVGQDRLRDGDPVVVAGET
ncbi:MAG: efflux RND transporter periplasmic adaptor subunit [Planctomycetes bacterium]|nr:efflux RND transporter periplasmic adaptor subunit [Planctomycetota bacterium]